MMRAVFATVVTSAVVLIAAPASAATIPGPPTAVTAVPGNGNATVSWAAPADTGGEAISSYTVTAQPSAATCSTPSLSCVVPGLSNGTAYTFTVTATNSAGTSVPSGPSTPVTPRTVPDAPTDVSGRPGNGRVTVAWRMPSADGGSPITSYRATAAPGGGSCTAPATSLACPVTGLSNGQAYTFTVTALNAAGASVPSPASSAVTPRATPSAPTAVTATAGNARATVTWTAPADNGGSPITLYTVAASPGSRACTTATLTCSVTGLTNGQAYTFTVRARNAAGSGAPSAASNPVTPVTSASAPRSVTAAASGDRTVSVSWAAPASNGGAAITGYRVTSVPDGRQCTTTSLTCTVEGLTPGTRYTFQVLATTSRGDGAVSTSRAVALPRLQQTAKVRTAKRVKFKGRTVVLRAPVVTNAGQTATTRITVSPGGKRFSKTIRRASGKIVLRTKGRRTLSVTLTVTAPATPEYLGYGFEKTWRVRRA